MELLSVKSDSGIIANDISKEDDMVCISSEAYKRLMDHSIELTKANEKIKMLTAKIEQKDQLIEKLKKTSDSNTHLTPVSYQAKWTNISITTISVY